MFYFAECKVSSIHQQKTVTCHCNGRKKKLRQQWSAKTHFFPSHRTNIENNVFTFKWNCILIIRKYRYKLPMVAANSNTLSIYTHRILKSFRSAKSSNNEQVQLLIGTLVGLNAFFLFILSFFFISHKLRLLLGIFGPMTCTRYWHRTNQSQSSCLYSYNLVLSYWLPSPIHKLLTSNHIQEHTNTLMYAFTCLVEAIVHTVYRP